MNDERHHLQRRASDAAAGRPIGRCRDRRDAPAPAPRRHASQRSLRAATPLDCSLAPRQRQLCSRERGASSAAGAAQRFSPSSSARLLATSRDQVVVRRRARALAPAPRVSKAPPSHRVIAWAARPEPRGERGCPMVRARYNHFLTSAEFWKTFSATWLLLFEADSVFCPSPTRSLRSFARFAFVGAPWRAGKHLEPPATCSHVTTNPACDDPRREKKDASAVGNTACRDVGSGTRSHASGGQLRLQLVTTRAHGKPDHACGATVGLRTLG